MELLEDVRFLIDLNDTQKGLYLMLLALAGKTNNCIRNDLNFIKSRLNLTKLDKSDLEQVSKIFPRFKLVNGYWTFEDFEEHHNYILPTKREFLRKSKGNPKACPEEEREEEKEKKRGSYGKKEEDFLTEIKKNSAYKCLSIETELAKMDAWLLTHKGRKKTKRFIVGWLNRAVENREEVENHKPQIIPPIQVDDERRA